MADLKHISLYGTCKHLEGLEPLECNLDEVPEVECWQCKKAWYYLSQKWWPTPRIDAHD